MNNDSQQSGRGEGLMAPSMKDVFGNIVAEIGGCLGNVDQRRLEQALQQITAAKRVFLAARGRSALGIGGFAMRLMHLGIDAHLVGETTAPPIRAGDCLIIGSGSGATASLVAHAAKAHEIGAKIVLFTINPESPIAQLADSVVIIPAPSPKARIAVTASHSIQPMGSLFEQCLFLVLDGLVLVLMQKYKMTSAEMFSRHANLE
jgi:6-phospho-3-hexuloisomerase